MNHSEIQELPEILTVAEVAAVLRCSRAHVYKLTAGLVEGVPRLECIRAGRKIIIRRVSLLDWLERAEQLSPAA